VPGTGDQPRLTRVFPIDVPVRDWVAYHAITRPEKTALHCIDTGESRTWAEFDRRVGAVAGGLRDALGIRPGDRVCLLAENDVRTFELHFACVRLGAIFAPLNWRLELTELRGIVDDCQPGLLVHDDEHETMATRLAAGRGLALLSWGAPTASSGYEQMAGAAAAVPGELLDPEAITQITYTSGTTGQPKGVTGANRAVTPGYWNRDEAGVFEGHWFRTGDLGRLGPEGGLYIVDRLKEIIRSGGTNVYPAEIERVLIEHPAVRDVAVVAVPDEQFGEVALAVVVPADGASVSLDELADFSRDRLARYKRPRHLVLTDELPRNASDKIERHVLRARYASRFRAEASGPVA
jgi:acyl-CoA synthetase (AMP-forming)/AMP-acid ligase II